MGGPEFPRLPGFGEIPVAEVPPTQPAMPPRITETQDLQADRVVKLIHSSTGWKLPEWSDADLVLSRASLKHVLARVEAEMGQRKLMPPSRGAR